MPCQQNNLPHEAAQLSALLDGTSGQQAHHGRHLGVVELVAGASTYRLYALDSPTS